MPTEQWTNKVVIAFIGIAVLTAVCCFTIMLSM